MRVFFRDSILLIIVAAVALKGICLFQPRRDFRKRLHCELKTSWRYPSLRFAIS